MFRKTNRPQADFCSGHHDPWVPHVPLLMMFINTECTLEVRLDFVLELNSLPR